MSDNQPPAINNSAGVIILNFFQRHIKLLMILLFGLLVITVGSSLASILNPVLLAFILAYILNPIVNFFEKRNINRTIIISFIILLFYWVVVVFFVLFISLVIKKVDIFISSLWSEDHWDITGDGLVNEDVFFEDLNENFRYDPQTEKLLKAIDWDKSTKKMPTKFIRLKKYGDKYIETKEIVKIPNPENVHFAEFVDSNNNFEFDAGILYNLYELGLQHGIEISAIFDEIEKILKQENSRELAEAGIAILGFTLDFIGSSITSIVWFILMLILVPIYTFYFLKGMNKIRDILIDYIPAKNRQRILDILFEIHATMGAFFRGRLIVSFLVAVITMIPLHILGVPFAVLIGLIHGITIIVPFASAVLVMIPTMLLTYLTFSNDPTIYAIENIWLLLVIELIVFAVIQWGEQLFLTPLLLSREVELHPMILIVSIFTGAFLLGAFGVIIAIPLAAVIKILSREFLLPKIREFAHGKSPTR